MGQAGGRPTRQKMLLELERLNHPFYTNINKSWQSSDSLSVSEYKKILKQSVFAPCPRGNRSVDSFRLYEALECGCIPIIEKDPYWKNLLGDHPLIECPPSWEGVGKDMSVLLQDKLFLAEHSKKVFEWWQNHKAALKDSIELICATPKDPPRLEMKQKEFLELKEFWTSFARLPFFNTISDLLPTEAPNSKKFSCYNPHKPIAIVSLYTSEISSYAIESEKNIRAYCEAQGYTFYIYRDSLDKESHGNWSKPKALLNHIDDHESLIWMDSDTLIFNPEKKFEDILNRVVPMKKIIACQDIGSNNKEMAKGSLLNSGVVIFRSHVYTKNIIARWADFPKNHDSSSLYASGGDQEVLINILKKSDPSGHNYKIFPMNVFNTDPRLADKDTFILHFMAYPAALKHIFMKYWNI